MTTVLPQLKRLEDQAAAEKKYDEAAKIASAAQELRSMLEAQGELNQRVERHAAARNANHIRAHTIATVFINNALGTDDTYSAPSPLAGEYAEASKAQQELQELEQGLQRLEKNIMADYGDRQKALPVQQPANLQPAVLVGAAVATRSLNNPVAVVIPEQPGRQPAGREPLLATGTQGGGPLIINGVRAPPGGVWSQEKYTGPSTFCFGFLCSPLIMACPLDVRGSPPPPPLYG